MSALQTQIAGEVRSVQASDGARLEYETLGNGPPLVALHGFAASRLTFSRQREPLAERHRLIMPSCRGHDGSDNRLPVNYGVGSSDVDDLCTILQAEHLDRVNLLAHSSGGATAFVFALRHPERVDRAVLIEPTLLGVLLPADRDRLIASLMPIVTAAEEEGPEAGLRAFVEIAAGPAWERLDAETQARRLQALASCAPLVGPHLSALFDLIVTEQDVRELCAPTLLFYGAESIPFEARIADRFRALRPDLSVVTVEKAGHNVHRDRADIVNAAVLSFLAPQER
jgi:pimeloyl-ACP methyl ester carboxylesterase